MMSKISTKFGPRDSDRKLLRFLVVSFFMLLEYEHDNKIKLLIIFLFMITSKVWDAAEMAGVGVWSLDGVATASCEGDFQVVMAAMGGVGGCFFFVKA